MRHRDLRPGSTAVTYLASALVLLGGLVSLTLMILSADSQPVPKILGVAAGTLLVAWILFSRDDRGPRHSAWYQFSWFRGRSASRPVWRPRIIRGPSTPTGSKQPPTANELREAAQNTSTWVPSTSRQKRDEP